MVARPRTDIALRRACRTHQSRHTASTNSEIGTQLLGGHFIYVVRPNLSQRLCFRRVAIENVARAGRQQDRFVLRDLDLQQYVDRMLRGSTTKEGDELAPTQNPEATTAPRYLTSYYARRTYAEEIQRPPVVNRVKDVIDIHCHAHDGQQDPLELAKYASANGMGGLLYKSIVGRSRPAESVRKLLEELHRWCDEQKVEPIRAWAGYNIQAKKGMAGADEVLEQINDGVVCIWMPTARHANTIHKVGGRPIWWDKDADPHGNTDPLPWEEAKARGYYLLDDQGRLKESIREIFHVIADNDVAVSFAHSTHDEQQALVEEVKRLGIKRAFIDHPFSPFVDLTPEDMREFQRAGMYINFTYDEISPLLGIDPAHMYQAIRSLDLDQVTLSSDCGEPLFPNSVEGMRLICSHMRAFGLSDDEVRQLSVVNPRKIVPWEAGGSRG